MFVQSYLIAKRVLIVLIAPSALLDSLTIFAQHVQQDILLYQIAMYVLLIITQVLLIATLALV